MRWPWQKRDLRHADPTPEAMFRLMLLTDDPWPTYLGDRAWCSGEPFWADHTCKCRHTEDREYA